MNGSYCVYEPYLESPQSYILQVRTVLFQLTGDTVTIPWDYKRCSASEYAVEAVNGSITCLPCPIGGNWYVQSSAGVGVTRTPRKVYDAQVDVPRPLWSRATT